VEPLTRMIEARCPGWRLVTRRGPSRSAILEAVHPRVTMQILRHSQITMTMGVYSEVPAVATRRTLKRLGSQLDG
jgi:hypothetical protein